MKKILALCVFLICLSPSVRAGNSVTLYGIVDIGVQYQSTRQNVTGTSESQQFFGIANGVQSGSRFGMRGVHDLGGGRESFFILENGFNSGNGTAAQGGRMFGRQVNLATNYFLPLDPFTEGFGQANIGASFGSTNTVRYSNMVLLQTQPTDGLTLGLGYSFATEMTGLYLGNASCTVATCQAINAGYQFQAGNNLRAVTIGAKYIRGPLLLAAGYDQLQGPANIPGGAPKPNPTAWVMGGLYNFEVGAATGGMINDITLGAGAAFLPGYGSNSYFLGLATPVERTTWLASIQRMEPVGNTLLSMDSAPQMIYSVGYLYNFTKRTNLYAYASYADNYAMLQSAQSTVLGVGLRHQF